MMPIYVGLHGKKGAGKDTVAGLIKRLLPGRRIRCVSFAYALREAIEKLSGGRIATKDTLSEEDKARHVPENVITWNWAAAFPETDASFRKRAEEVLSREQKMTIGRLLQVVGTEIARNMIAVNYWVDRLDAQLKQDKETEVFLFTDTRFPNEYDYIRAKQLNLLMSIRRPIPETAVTKDGRSNTHPSETALDHIPATGWNVIIDNNSTLAHLEHLVTSDVLPALATRSIRLVRYRVIP